MKISTTSRRQYGNEMEALKMKEEMKLLNAEELEMVSGGTIDWRHFSEEVREASERGDV